MDMRITPSVRVDIRLEISGGVTLTVFPMSERWLNEGSDHQSAVKEVRARHKGADFRSLMDYLFANVFVGTYRFVVDFYEGEAPPLCEILTREQCHMIDSVLVESLKLAYADFCEDRVRAWSKIRKISDSRYYRTVA